MPTKDIRRHHLKGIYTCIIGSLELSISSTSFPSVLCIADRHIWTWEREREREAVAGARWDTWRKVGSREAVTGGWRRRDGGSGGSGGSGAVTQWGGGAVGRWGGGAVTQWRSDAVTQWRSEAVTVRQVIRSFNYIICSDVQHLHYVNVQVDIVTFTYGQFL